MLFGSKIATDELPHDFGGPAVNALNACMGIQAADLILAHEPVAAEELQTLIHETTLHLAAPELGDRCLLRVEFSFLMFFDHDAVVLEGAAGTAVTLRNLRTQQTRLAGLIPEPSADYALGFPLFEVRDDLRLGDTADSVADQGVVIVINGAVPWQHDRGARCARPCSRSLFRASANLEARFISGVLMATWTSRSALSNFVTK